MEEEEVEDHSSSTNNKDVRSNTPTRPARGAKGKCLSPLTLLGKQSPGHGEVATSSAKRRRKSASSMPHGRTGSPLLKPSLTERQQMALIMQMTDLQKKASLSGGEESACSTPKSESSWTPRSRLQKRNERGETLLHTACIKGDIKVATSLIDKGADINTTDNAGWTPLHEACNHGHLKVVSLLLKHRADANSRGMDGDTPLHDAAVNGHLATVHILLKYGGDPYQMNDQELTPIDTCKNEEIVHLMKEWPSRHRPAHEDSEDEDVFTPCKETRLKRCGSQLRTGSKGSSHSSIGDEDSDGSVVQGICASPEGIISTSCEISRGVVNTPTSRPRGVLYSELSSSESDDEVLPGQAGIPKRRYHLTKMGEAKQRLLGKLEESGELDKKVRRKEDSDEHGCEEDSEVCAPDDAERCDYSGDRTCDVECGHKEEEERSNDGESEVQKASQLTRPSQQQPQVENMCSSLVASSPPLPHPHPTSDHLDNSPPSLPSSPPLFHLMPPDAELEDGYSEVPVERKSTMEVLTDCRSSRSPDSSSPEDDVDKEDVKLIDTPETSPTKIPTKIEVSVKEDKEDDDEKDETNDHISMSPSEQNPNPMDMIFRIADPPSISHSPPAANGSSVLLAPPDDTQEATPTKEKDPPSSSEGESFDRVLRSAVKRSHIAVREKEKEREQFLVSWNLKKLKRPLASEAFSMSCSLPRLDLESSYKHGPKRLLSERQDSSRSSGYLYDSHYSNAFERVVSEHAHTKHGLTAHQQVLFNSTSMAKVRERKQEGKVRSDSLSVSLSLDGAVPVMPSHHGVSHSAPCSTVSSPQQLMLQSEAKKEDGMEEDEEEGGRGSTSTLVSFPLTFSDILESVDSSDFAPHHLHRDGNDDIDGIECMGGISSGGVLTHKISMSADTGKPVLAASRATLSKREKGFLQQQNIVLPLKKRYYRPVLKSAVIQQRQKAHTLSVTGPAHLSSFLMYSKQYRSNQKLDITDPKLVYPPLAPAMHKLFSEHEAERIQLIAAHLTEQDRVVLCMEQELLRAHQRATRDHIPLSACSFLLENLQNQSLGHRRTGVGLIDGCGHYDPFHANESRVGMTSPSCEGEGPVDCRLLTGLVQDVWDKFQELRLHLLSRQQQEAESLWAVQHSQWTHKTREIGLPPSFFSCDLPNPHIPLATPIRQH